MGLAGSDLAWLLGCTARELTLFAAIGFLLGGLDDLAIDLIWIERTIRRRLTVYRRHARATAETLPPPRVPGRFAIFVPAWDESAVIGAMLRATLARYDHRDYRIYVGTYPNDLATIAAVRAVGDPRVRLVEGAQPGPTSKAECLNRMWAALQLDERTCGFRYKGVVLHDAEDVVHRHELRVFDRLIEKFDLIQLPVQPLIVPGTRWISAHYADEFAEAHGKQLVVREALGAGIPSAGVGCAISREALQRMAGEGDRPFDEDSLTEDYELGLRLARFGGQAAFVAIPAAPGAELVAVRAYFPDTFETSVRQKTRWLKGIALAGWDRLGWQGGLAESWMRLRDRRGVLAAFVLAAGYLAIVLNGLCWLLGVAPIWPAWAGWALLLNLWLLIWRLGVRASLVTNLYGWRQGVLAVPRALIGNLIALVAAFRAIRGYRPGARQAWDKTRHHFPDNIAC